MDNMKKRLAGLDMLKIARILMVAELVALLVSTSLAVATEMLIYLVFAVSSLLRKRVWQAARQPMVSMTMVWAAVLIIAALYSIGPAPETIANLSSWRKLLILPLAVAVFDSAIWKRRLIVALLLTVTLGALLSYFSWFSGVALYKYRLGIALHNHSIQGMMFALSLFVIAIWARYSAPLAKGWYYFLPFSVLVIFSNLILITPGRSGYLVLLVLAAIGAFCMASGKLRYLLAFGIPLGIALLLYFSPVANQRIVQGVNEIRNYQHSAELTSMGIRVVMWKNTMEMVREKPWLGYGTGGFSEAYRRQVEGQLGWQGQPAEDCHNQFLRIVAEQGVVGLAVFLLFIGSFFCQRVAPVFRIMGLGVLLAWCATSLFSAHFSTFTEGRFLYLWCGAMLAEKGSNDDEIAA